MLWIVAELYIKEGQNNAVVICLAALIYKIIYIYGLFLKNGNRKKKKTLNPLLNHVI